MRDSEKSKDPTISSPMRYADLKRQNFPIDPLPLTMLYTSVEKKNKKAKFKNKVLLSHLELPSKTPCQVKLMLLDFTKKLDWSKLIQITHRSNCNFTYLIWSTTLNEHPPCW